MKISMVGAILIGLLLITFLLMVPVSEASAQSEKIGASGLPLPRFVSLKSDKVNVRIGPSREFGITWTFVRAGLPVEIIQEYDNWRKIRDWEGAEGWVFHSLLSGRRTALVKPWEDGGTVSMHRNPGIDSAVVARLQPRVFVNVFECDSNWCKISAQGHDGWIEQSALFGIYPNEVID